MEGGLARHVHTAPPQLTLPRHSRSSSVHGSDEGDEGEHHDDAHGGRDSNCWDEDEDARGRQLRDPRSSVVVGANARLSWSVGGTGGGGGGRRRAPRPSGVLRWDDGGGFDYAHMPRPSDTIQHLDDELPREPRKSVFAWSEAGETEELLDDDDEFFEHEFDDENENENENDQGKNVVVRHSYHHRHQHDKATGGTAPSRRPSVSFIGVGGGGGGGAGIRDNHDDDDNNDDSFPPPASTRQRRAFESSRLLDNTESASTTHHPRPRAPRVSFSVDVMAASASGSGAPRDDGHGHHRGGGDERHGDDEEEERRQRIGREGGGGEEGPRSSSIRVPRVSVVALAGSAVDGQGQGRGYYDDHDRDDNNRLHRDRHGGGGGKPRMSTSSMTRKNKKNKDGFSLAFKPRVSQSRQRVSGGFGAALSVAGDSGTNNTEWGMMSTQYTGSEMWDEDSSSEDEASIIKDEDDEEEDDAGDGRKGGEEEEDVDNDGRGEEGGSERGRKGEGNVDDDGGSVDTVIAEDRSRRKANRRRRALETALVDAVPEPTDDPEIPDIHKIDWSYQNLERVPPGLKRKMRKTLRCLVLSHNRIWKLPSNLALFECLVELDASHNRLERVPPALGRCKRLEVLSLHGNRLRKLGAWVVELPLLRRLHVYDNPMIDPPASVSDLGVEHVREYLRAMKVIADWDPDEVTTFDRHGADTKGLELRHVLFKSAFFARFTSLTRIDVSGARLTTLPPTMVTCYGLTELVVDDNGLTSLPDLRACAKLRKVSCGRCRLAELPEWMGACSRLVELDASSNKIASPLPSLRGCKALKTVNLRRNSMRELPRLPAGLTRLFASGNDLDEISNVTDCVDLEELDLERNKITTLPDDLADLHRLEIINVCKNLLHSIDVPGMSRRAPKLRELKISSNPLGAVPWWLADVPREALEVTFAQECATIWKLRVLPDYVRNLDLGNIGLLVAPTVHPHLPNITTLRLSSNSIAFLPRALSDLVLMRHLHLDDNIITFLPDLSRMTHLKELRVQGNRLVRLTPTICDLAELEVLYIGRNPLTEIPNLSRCVALTMLWMADCQLTTLPLFLADVPKLANFYCEGNPLKFPDPKLYEQGGNEEVLKHLRIVAENKKEQAEIERIRKDKAEAKAAKAAAKAKARMEREKLAAYNIGGGGGGGGYAADGVGGGGLGGAVGGSSADEEEGGVDGEHGDSFQRQRGSLRGSVASSGGSRRNSVAGSYQDNVDDDDNDEKERAAGSSMAKLLWRRVRRVVIEEKKVREAADQGGKMDYDMLLRARELKVSIKLANAQEDVAALEEDVDEANNMVREANANLVTTVQEIRDIKDKIRRQRELMKEYKSISDDYLRELQERLRERKKTLRHAVETKEATDKEFHERERRLEAKRAKIFELRVESDEIAEEHEERSKANMMEKMTKRREDLETIRAAAEEGEKTMQRVLRDNETTLAERSANLRKSYAMKEDYERELRDQKGAMLAYHQQMGMDKGNDSTVAGAKKAWGRMQIRKQLGVFK